MYRDKVSARMGVRHSLLLARLPWNSLSDDLRDPTVLALTGSDVCLRLISSQSTSTYSALEVSHFMRYTNLRLTYFLTGITTFWLTQKLHVFGQISKKLFSSGVLNKPIDAY